MTVATVQGHLAAIAQSSSGSGSSIFSYIIIIAVLAGGGYWFYIKTQARKSEMGDTPGEKTYTARGFNYLGGYPEYEKPVQKVSLHYTRKLLRIEGPTMNALFQINMDTVRSVAVETEEELRHRMTLTRMALVGLFAFAWRKRTAGSVMVSIETDSGTILFEKPKATKPTVLADLANLRSMVGGAGPGAPAADSSTPPVATAPSSVTDRLQELEKIWEQGLISDEAFEEKRDAILREL